MDNAFTISDDLSIPFFLDRNKNKDLIAAVAEASKLPLTEPPAYVKDKKALEPDVLAYLQEQERLAKVEAANGRIARQARKEAGDIKGKRWDSRTNRWIPDTLPQRDRKEATVMSVGEKSNLEDNPKKSLPLKITRKRGKRGESDVKQKTLLEMLTRPEGATKKEIGERTGWLEHTAGARISGVKSSYSVTRKKEPPRGTVYRAIPK